MEDFHPIVGNYKTDVYRIPVNLNGKNIDKHFVALPEPLKTMTSFIFVLTNPCAVIGIEIFEHFNCTLDWDKEEIM